MGGRTAPAGVAGRGRVAVVEEHQAPAAEDREGALDVAVDLPGALLTAEWHLRPRGLHDIRAP